MKHPLSLDRGWATIDAATSLVNKDRATIYRWIKAGYLRTQKTVRRTYVRLDDLMVTELDLRENRAPDTPGKRP